MRSADLHILTGPRARGRRSRHHRCDSSVGQPPGESSRECAIDGDGTYDATRRCSWSSRSTNSDALRSYVPSPSIARCSARISLAGSPTQRISAPILSRIAVFPDPGAPVRIWRSAERIGHQAFHGGSHAVQLRSSTRKSSAWLAPIFSPSSTASFARNSSKNRIPSVELALVLRERGDLRVEVARDVLDVVGLVRPSEPDVVHLAHVQTLLQVLGEVVRVAGAREHRVERDLAGGAMVRVVVVAVLEEPGSRDRPRRRSRRAPRGSGGSRPRGRRAVFASSPSAMPRLRALARPRNAGGGLRLDQPGRGELGAILRPVARARSPFVRTSRCTSRPAATHFAIVPPAEISASSGCA